MRIDKTRGKESWITFQGKKKKENEETRTNKERRDHLRTEKK